MMVARLKRAWYSWRLKRLLKKKARLEKEYICNVLKLSDQLDRLPPQSRAVSMRRILVKEIERRILLVDKKITAIDPSQSGHITFVSDIQ